MTEEQLAAIEALIANDSTNYDFQQGRLEELAHAAPALIAEIRRQRMALKKIVRAWCGEEPA